MRHTPLPWMQNETHPNVVRGKDAEVGVALTHKPADAQLIVHRVNTWEQAIRLAREAVNGWGCHAKRQIEHDEIGRIHRALDALHLAESPTEETQA